MTFHWPEALTKLSGITIDEVTQALHASRRMPLAASTTGVRILAICARTLADRPLIVTTRLLPNRDQQIISARDMTARELAHFQAWEASSL